MENATTTSLWGLLCAGFSLVGSRWPASTAPEHVRIHVRAEYANCVFALQASGFRRALRYEAEKHRRCPPPCG